MVERVTWRRPSVGGRSLHALAKVRWSLIYYGAGSTMLFFLTKVLRMMGGGRDVTEWYKTTSSIWFDRRFGVETSGFVSVADLDVSDEQKKRTIQYQPTAAVTFGALIEKLEIKYSEHTFLDYGSGKGRALILAAHFPFKHIVGVELSPSLSSIAKENIRTLRTDRVRCKEVEIVCCDATSFMLPDGASVVYLFHPFKAPVLEKVLDNVRHSLKASWRHVIIVYQYPLNLESVPDCRKLLESSEFLNRRTLSLAGPGWDVFETVESAPWKGVGGVNISTVQ